jgi:solute carrier family 5 (sodium-coupled monocarboxylate transporter), member 8/12
VGGGKRTVVKVIGVICKCIMTSFAMQNLLTNISFTVFKNSPGLSGIFVAGIFSGALSSVSSTLNSLAAITLEDYIKPLYLKITKKEWTNSSAFMSKVIVFIYGTICIGSGYFAESLGSVFESAIILFGVVGGPLLGLFTLGMATEIANQRGVILPTLISIATSIWIGFSPKPKSDRNLEFSTAECSEFGGMFKNVTQDNTPDDKE